MSKDTPESWVGWLRNKPFWEQYLWHINLEKDSLGDADISQCFEYLCEYLGLIPPLLGDKPVISFGEETPVSEGVLSEAAKYRIVEIKNFEAVNAIPHDRSVKFGPSLTLIYGNNGSGKSGVGRLLCSACFSRGERKILPNAHDTYSNPPLAKATFVIGDGNGNTSDIEYSLGDRREELKRFSVFDSKSVPIHLDDANRINFTPAQIKIFDKVADTISKLEAKLLGERSAQRKDNPFSSMFLDGNTSPISVFVKGFSAETDSEKFISYANFDGVEGEREIRALEEQINEKKKLDVSKKKAQLQTEQQHLKALKAVLGAVVGKLDSLQMAEVNRLMEQIGEKKTIVASLSVQSFDDGLLKTIGSPEWKALISTAKSFYFAEKRANEEREPDYCLLCHQRMSEETQALFKKYWQFLESKAEAELANLERSRQTYLENLKRLLATYPEFRETDVGIKILMEEAPELLEELKRDFVLLLALLNDWIAKIGDSNPVDREAAPPSDLDGIDKIVKKKSDEASSLIDPSAEIAVLGSKLRMLQHAKQVTSVKDSALAYLEFLKWSAKSQAVNFAGMKMATTRKRTESFLANVAQDYKTLFNQELERLGCSFNLVMSTTGEQGNTVKEYRLDFAKEYNPSQILSEGEQNACSIADFLTEAQLDKKNCGIIFDDPVTSLDHGRKDKIALRLALEALQRQVVIFTHDIVFMGQLAKHAAHNAVPFEPHWMRQINGLPGYVEYNTSPKLASLASLKKDSQDAIKDFASMGSKEQERTIGVAFDYLRSACEALVEELLFAGTIQRYDDQVRMHNLSEVGFDSGLALEIVELHEQISGMLLAHNRSDLQRENLPSLADFTDVRDKFEDLEKRLRDARKVAKKARSERKETKEKQTAGW